MNLVVNQINVINYTDEFHSEFEIYMGYACIFYFFSTTNLFNYL